jgi:hypothetical protein
MSSIDEKQNMNEEEDLGVDDGGFNKKDHLLELSNENAGIVKIIIESFEADKKLQEAQDDANNQRRKVILLESENLKILEEYSKLLKQFSSAKSNFDDIMKEEKNRRKRAADKLRKRAERAVKTTVNEVIVNSSSSNTVAVNAVHDDNNDQEKDNNKRKLDNDDESSSSNKKIKDEVKDPKSVDVIMKKNAEIEQLKKQVDFQKNKIRVSFFFDPKLCKFCFSHFILYVISIGEIRV